MASISLLEHTVHVLLLIRAAAYRIHLESQYLIMLFLNLDASKYHCASAIIWSLLERYSFKNPVTVSKACFKN